MNNRKCFIMAILCLCSGSIISAKGDDGRVDTSITANIDSAGTLTGNRPKETASHDTANVALSHNSSYGSGRDLLIVRETRDTVFVFDKTPVLNAVRNWRKNIDILRQRSIGLSGSSMYGAYAVSVAPLEELIETDRYLSGKHFNFMRFSYEPFLMSGGMGCIGLGEGFRLGGGGMVGERKFNSDPFSGDSIIMLGMKVSYGGFMVEKAVVRDRWNFTAGGTIGGGSIKVVASEKNSSSWFTGDDDFDDFDETFENGNSAEAGFVLMEPHCGFSYTFFHFFHIGANVSLPTFISVEKFNILTNDFFSVNPGFYLKLIFGNLG